jgi:nucleotide-binding universal stress UspA family protein
VVSGEAAHEIVDIAELERVDLIVMATHGRSGLSRLTTGSVATRVLQLTKVPVVLVRPPQVAHQRDVTHEAEMVPVIAPPVWFGG